MPPPKTGEKATGKGKKGDAAAPAVAAKDAASSLTPQQDAERRILIEKCKHLKTSKVFEEAQVAQFHEEKERLNYLWIVTKKSLEDSRATLRIREREKEDVDEAHGEELKVYRERIRHLLFEHEVEDTEAKTEVQQALSIAHTAHLVAEGHVGADTRQLRTLARGTEAAHEDFIRSLRMDQDRAITELRWEFETEMKRLTAQHNEKLARLRDELNQERTRDVASIEQRKSSQVSTLAASHERAFADIKAYFNEITHSNLDLIKSLKEELETLKRRETDDERVMFSIAQENKRMSEPMRKALEEVKRLTAEREIYRSEIGELTTTKAAISKLQTTLDAESRALESAKDLKVTLTAERDALFERFSAALRDLQQKSGFRAMVLQRTLHDARLSVTQTEIVLDHVKAVAATVTTTSPQRDARVRSLGQDIQPAADVPITRPHGKLAAAIESTDAELAAAEAAVADASAAHSQLIATYLDLLREHAIPAADLGFVPMSAAQVVQAVQRPA